MKNYKGRGNVKKPTSNKPIKITRELILDILEIPLTRDQICEAIGLKKLSSGLYERRSTIYDMLKVMINNNLVGKKRMKITDERGRPQTLFYKL